MPGVEQGLDSAAIPTAIQGAIRRWYAANRRRLAFRATSAPWAVLVSEVMLQQTQVPRVESAWSRFMDAFPTPAALAAATPADAIRAWAGLGYNRRALNLWRTAVAITERHGGHVPSRLEELRALPGVGAYTARAVAAIAFGQPVAAVDTNVRRVVRRLHGIDGKGSPEPRALQALADALVDLDAPADWTHGMMDIGATVCRPGQPRCEECPLVAWCRTAASRSVATVARLPTRSTARTAASVRFEETARWLRGRIVDVLRAAPSGAWLTIDAPIGSHDAACVARALTALASEGLIELVDGTRARLAGGAAA
jgi:A/G-specific adenine glycosylase